MGGYAMNCANRSKSSHRIPPTTDKLKRKQWIHNMRRDICEIDVDNIRFCSDHFTDDCYELDLRAEQLGQKEGPVNPTLFLLYLPFLYRLLRKRASC